MESQDYTALAEKITTQPLQKLSTQFATAQKITVAEISNEAILLELLLNSLRKDTKGSHRGTIFHAAGIEIMQMWVTRLNDEHDLKLSTEDIQKSFDPPTLASILYAQMVIYGE
jgi:hypothetical protein